MSQPIKNLVDEAEDLKKFLIDNAQLSLSISVDEHFRKVLLLSCASLYEKELCEMLKAFIVKETKNCMIHSFVTNKAIERQYHTYFQWKDLKNINSFLGLFGEEFKSKISNEISSNSDLKMQMKAFLEIGSERNKLVHENFLIYKLNKTFQEILILHSNAEKFLTYLKSLF